MALHRCAACGSPNVVTDTQSGGISYNFMKGALGTVAFGTGGAVAGIESQTQTVYKCSDCSMTLTYAMPLNLKMAIDLCVNSCEAREKLSELGIPVSWEFLCQKYKNIESGAGDRLQELRKQIDLTKKEVQLTAEKYDVTIDVIKKYDQLPELLNKPEASQSELADMQMQWELSVKWVDSLRTNDLAQRKADLTLKGNASIAQLEQEKQKKIEESNQQLADARNELNEANQELSRLGIFKAKEKKALKQLIEIHSTNILAFENKIEEIPAEYEAKIEDEKAKYQQLIEALPEQVAEDNPYPVNPCEREARIRFLRSTRQRISELKQQVSPKVTETDISILEAKCIILLTLEQVNKKVNAEFLNHIADYVLQEKGIKCDIYSEYERRNRTVTTALGRLVREDNLLIRTEGRRFAYFELK